ncbi:hypothetical protein BFJ63_vAg19527 [Fusarium oxysporum f. sp. narcissi]|uniref:Uncharacterized protein n=1 Tax=Fusarium oxysporum f. sp. narcissi TaxID=451672 RepID=A0A4Q2UVM4_FUSOX|nr:hypothetical protein BFJ63_vAg19527 [Fusarium oxysporum f. sp. narcissi]
MHSRAARLEYVQGALPQATITVPGTDTQVRSLKRSA